MTIAPDIATDLVTPLGAYLRLVARDALPSCSSRWSAAGSAGTRSSVPVRTSVTWPRPRRAASPSSATSPTTTPRAWNQLSSSRPRAPDPGEPLPRRRHPRPLRSRPRHRGSHPRRPGRCRAPLRTPGAAPASSQRQARLRQAHTRARRLRGVGARSTGAHPRRRRLPDRAVTASGASNVRVGARPLPRTAPRQPIAVPVPARARRPRPDRIIARDARQVRGTECEPEPDRGNDGARPRRRRALACIGERPRGACDARRPRPKRSLARLRVGHRRRHTLPRGRALLPCHSPRLAGER